MSPFDALSRTGSRNAPSATVNEVLRSTVQSQSSMRGVSTAVTLLALLRIRCTGVQIAVGCVGPPPCFDAATTPATSGRRQRAEAALAALGVTRHE
jgi:hypothetical protein